MNYCCETMEQQLEPCDQHGTRCPEKVIWRYGGDYGFPLPDSSYIQAKVCPFCGCELQQWDGPDYEQIEPSAGNVKFAQDILERLIEKSYWILSEMHEMKEKKRINPLFHFESARLDGETVKVTLRYKRAVANEPDDVWGEEFPVTYLQDKNWKEKYKAELSKDEA
ncbi:hypothetical protein D3C81_519880 [compost metagenome]